jgi:selenocysteine-specific elongation factor
VIGTAGHVDHGKTALVRALTGEVGDRLPEEKKRGITIELGYARWKHADVDASVIDVPGHERFVGTMVAGAAGIDVVLLVVAADDGVMPQTREHVAVCRHLGIARGVIAITKSDLADAEMLALVEEDVRDAVRGTFLERAEVVRCSSSTGEGIEALAEALARSLRARRAAPSDGPVWLPIDRAFVRHGHGTVVTGTLVRGTLASGATLGLLGGRVDEVVVRGLAVHGGEVARASAPTRLAVNVRGLEPSMLPRGAVLTTFDGQTTTTSVDALLSDDDVPLRGELVLHVGASHVVVRAKALGHRVVRLTSTTPFATHAGDRFVLRRPERAKDRTVGGGTILDPHPSLARPPKLASPPALDPRGRVVAITHARPAGATQRELAVRLPPATNVRAIVDSLVREGVLIEAAADDGPRFVAASELARAKAEVRRALAELHAKHPAAGGASAAELAGAVPAPWRPLVPAAIAALVREGTIAGGERVAAIGHDALALAAPVSEIYARAGLAILAHEAAREASGLPERTFRDVVAELVRAKRIERIADGVHVDRAALDALAERVRAFLDANGTMSPGDFKTLSGLTRKHAIATLEWLDRRGVTRRDGDVRVRP